MPNKVKAYELQSKYDIPQNLRDGLQALDRLVLRQ
jgi:hypothetical protein